MSLTPTLRTKEYLGALLLLYGVHLGPWPGVMSTSGQLPVSRGRLLLGAVPSEMAGPATTQHLEGHSPTPLIAPVHNGMHSGSQLYHYSNAEMSAPFSDVP